MDTVAFEIRPARAEELSALGALVADAYAALPGMPAPGQQPGYYAMVRDAPARARNPAIRILAAVGSGGELLASADLITEMAQYGSGGTATMRTDAAGIRLLAVASTARGRGVGKALTRDCIERARAIERGPAHHPRNGDRVADVRAARLPPEPGPRLPAGGARGLRLRAPAPMRCGRLTGSTSDSWTPDRRPA